MDNRVQCKGSMMLGSGCGRCLKCLDELARMKAAIKRAEEKLDEPPKPLEAQDWEPVRKMVIEAVAEIVATKRNMDDDLKHYIYEAAFEVVYGKDFWPWHNRQKLD